MYRDFTKLLEKHTLSHTHSISIDVKAKAKCRRNCLESHLRQHKGLNAETYTDIYKVNMGELL